MSAAADNIPWIHISVHCPEQALGRNDFEAVDLDLGQPFGGAQTARLIWVTFQIRFSHQPLVALQGKKYRLLQPAYRSPLICSSNCIRCERNDKSQLRLNSLSQHNHFMF